VTRKTLLPSTLEQVQDAVVRACRVEPNLILAYLHGSAVRGEAAADIDVAVLLEEPLDAGLVLAATERVAARVEREAAQGLPVDVRLLNGTGPAFRFRVLQEGRRLYERSADERIVLEAEWASDWHDFQP